MGVNGCVAMILADGHNERLGALTHYYPKPTIHFSDKHRIIDFTILNCRNSGIHTTGILSQYFSNDLQAYIESNYDCRSKHGEIYLISSQDFKAPQEYPQYYRGTADAIYQNIGFIEQFQPECILVLTGDHIYQMDYGKMIAFHRKVGASVTIASASVPIQEASKFGILNADKTGRVYCFEEQPIYPKSRLASMGIFVFQWDVLKKHLLADNRNKQTCYDFGRDVLPEMLHAGEQIYAYEFTDYWRDVGTVDGLWEANMDLINQPSAFQPWYDEQEAPAPTISDMSYSTRGAVRQSVVSEGCSIFGRVEHSVLGEQVTVGKEAEIIDSVIMPGVYIGNNAKIYKTVVGPRAIIMDGAAIGTKNGSDFFIDRNVCARDISLVAPWLYIAEGMSFRSGSHIYKERLQNLAERINMAQDLRHNQMQDERSGSFSGQALSAYR